MGCHFLLQCMRVKSENEVAQSCPTLRDPMDCSPPGSSIHGIFQARVLEWGAIASMCSINWRRQWHPTPVLLLGKSHGRRSLVGCSPWDHEESEATEQLHFHFSLSCIGEGDGNPLQCFCLENPRDSGAWWAAVYGVTQSWTRLKQLSSWLFWILWFSM